MMILVVLSLVLDPGLRQSAIIALTAKGGHLVQSLSEIDWQLLKLDRKALDNDRLFAAPGKNLVLIYMEGLDVIYTEEDIFPGLTPNLNRLNSEGARLHTNRGYRLDNGWNCFLPLRNSKTSMEM